MKYGGMLKREQESKPDTSIIDRWKAAKQKTEQPKSRIGRWVNFVMLEVVALGSFLIFYLIRFDICSGFNCRKLEITGMWYLFSPGFILLGAAVMMVARFILDEINLPSRYSDYITFSIVVAALLLLFIPIGISIEVGSTVSAK
jgi:hypothetical protein